jgi:hypothetical protein
MDATQLVISQEDAPTVDPPQDSVHDRFFNAQHHRLFGNALVFAFIQQRHLHALAASPTHQAVVPQHSTSLNHRHLHA